MASTSYQGLPRKYRPANFGDLVGQEAVTMSLMKALEGDRLVHGHILSGPRGVGKTTSARIIARALNCKDGPTANPCGKCEQCVAITQGNAMDVLEFDAASHTGVDDMRELLERAQLAPFSGKYKTYIVDEVHMLSKAAFNALLKTLEEPPENVVFIFATTELEKIPETIRSRCAVHNFRRLTNDDIIQRLGEVAKAEGIKLKKAEAREIFGLIAQASEGGMRDALVSFDQLLSMSGGKPTSEGAEILLGLSSQSSLADVIEALAASDAQKILVQIDELVMKGRSLERFVKGMTAYLHDVMMIQAGAPVELISLTDQPLERAKELAEKIDQTAVFNMLNQLFELEEKMKQSTQIRFLVEFTFLRMGVIKPVLAVDQLIQRISAMPDGPASGPPAAAPESAPVSRSPEPVSAAFRKQAPASRSGSQMMAGSDRPSAAMNDSAAPAKESASGSAGAMTTHEMSGLSPEELLDMLMAQLPDANRFLVRYLKTASGLRCDATSFWIQWPSDGQLQARMIEKPANLKALRETLADIAGHPIEVNWDFSSQTMEPEAKAARPARAKSTPVLADSGTLDAELRDEAYDGDSSEAEGQSFEEGVKKALATIAVQEGREPVRVTTTREQTLTLLEQHPDLAKRARMLRDFFNGSFVDSSGNEVPV